jgi:FlaG/FlaF family flagellin (archaellin)
MKKYNKKSENKFLQEKKAVSEMIAYVILIGIAIGLAIGVFSWLKDYANVNPKIDCKAGTSIILENYTCTNEGGSGKFTINLKNNGLFDINGIFMMVGNNSQRQPIDRLNYIDSTQGNIPGYYTGRINVSESQTIGFYMGSLTQIQIIQIQPFILDSKNKKILCEQGIIKENLNGCVLS